jgi:hypothetical protein
VCSSDLEGKPATAEGKPAAETSSGTLQGLMKDGIVPTTIAFQDLINKGIKPFQSMMSGVQAKTPLDKGAVKPEDSLKKGEEIVSSVDKKALEAERDAKLKEAEARGAVSVSEIQKNMAKGMSQADAQKAAEQSKTRGMYDKESANAYVAMGEARDPGTGELLSSAKDLTKGLSIPSEDMTKTIEKMATLSKQDQSWETTFLKQSQEKERGIYDEFVNGFDLVGTNLASSSQSVFGAFGEDLRAIQDEGIIKQSTATISDSEARKSELEAVMNDGATRTGKEWDQIFEEYDQVVAKIKDVNDANINDYSSVLAEVKDQKVDIAASETAKVELVAQAEKKAADIMKAAEEAAQAEKDKLANQTTTMASSQEGAPSESTDLNTALAELIAISKRTAELNEKQLSVQSSLSGDLFA